MIDTFYNGHDVHAKLEGDRVTRAGCRCENMVCFLFVTLGLPARGGHTLAKYCVMVYGPILILFLPFSEVISLSEG